MLQHERRYFIFNVNCCTSCFIVYLILIVYLCPLESNSVHCARENMSQYVLFNYCPVPLSHTLVCVDEPE